MSRGESRMVTDVCHEFSFLSRIFEFSNFLHTECRGGHGLSNYRIFFTRSVAEGHGFFFLSRIVGFFSSHGVSRKVTGVLLFSDYRIVSSHGESRKVTNYRIIFTRNVAEDHGFFFTLNVGSAEVWVTRRCGCLFLYVTVKIMCISWVSQTSIRR